jgi:Cys-tRNA(Pro) deacylase
MAHKKAKENTYPVTAGIRFLRAHKGVYVPHVYPFEYHGHVSETCARLMGVDLHLVVKTLVMEDEGGHPFLILMPGDKEVSTKGLARIMGVKKVSPCIPEIAEKYSGFKVGGCSPFGARRAMPVYMEEEILEQESVYINGGKRGFILEMNPEEIRRLIQPVLVNVGI